MGKEMLSEKDKDWLMKQKTRANKASLILTIIFFLFGVFLLFGSLTSTNQYARTIWGERALFNFVFSCALYGTRSLISRYLKIIDKLMD